MPVYSGIGAIVVLWNPRDLGVDPEDVRKTIADTMGLDLWQVEIRKALGGEPQIVIELASQYENMREVLLDLLAGAIFQYQTMPVIRVTFDHPVEDSTRSFIIAMAARYNLPISDMTIDSVEPPGRSVTVSEHVATIYLDGIENGMVEDLNGFLTACNRMFMGTTFRFFSPPESI